MSDSVEIQILMPVYNAGEHLDAAIQSIVDQSLRDWQLLILDDGSTDSSLLIAQKWQEKEPRIRVKSRENRGLVATLNELTAWSTAPLLARMDADDLSAPQRLAQQFAAIQTLSRPAAVGCWVSLFGAKQAVWHYREHDNDIRMLAFFGRCPLIHASLLADREVFEGHPFQPQYTHIEDLDFLFRLVGQSNVTLHNVQEDLYHYRQHSDSVIYQHEELRDRQYRLRFTEFLSTAGLELTDEEVKHYMDFCYNCPTRFKTVETVLNKIANAIGSDYPGYLAEAKRRLTMAKGTLMATDKVATEQVKPRALIFGAGLAGQRSLSHIQEQYDVLGFIDNDSDKHGSMIQGLPINAPETERFRHVDAVFVASEYFEQIQGELLERFGVTPSKVRNIPARMMTATTFADSGTHSGANIRILQLCCQQLEQSGLYFHIDAGTLLGLYRDNSLIPWDDDLDFAVSSAQLDELKVALAALQQELARVCRSHWDLQVLYTDQGFGNVPAGALRSFKLCCKDKQDLPSIDFFVKYADQQHSDYCLASRGIRMPAALSRQLSTQVIDGFSYPIPAQTDDYLTTHYGDWRTPDKNWNLQSLNNTTVF
ncbi:glycosyltransferase [Alteromonas sp. ASW11-36]|uniref:Glycosyltransferase n=1 Tax=Alteromonas arenosi TaxID=3055817 RepID=A0ABT7SVB7_9ALTE|nr:glycosyltransferase [Alteromonas sp. ASW11-36]MDM7860142.1 glycosyltransferase [Alteromonas sp. ASW11-36]